MSGLEDRRHERRQIAAQIAPMAYLLDRQDVFEVVLNDPGRVWMLAGAIWSALTGMGLAYAVPPASFEKTGQKVRDPDRIRSEGLADTQPLADNTTPAGRAKNRRVEITLRVAPAG